MLDQLFIQGDVFYIPFIYTDEDNNPINLTNYEIRFELFRGEMSIKKANSVVSGGSADQIEVNEEAGEFTVIVLPNETKDLTGVYNIEIELKDPDGYPETVLQDKIQVLPEKITWDQIE